tara:strand:+ start:351 stop:596 length:246 start_codon:yes stop_codon:yes gene_type:complete
MKDIKTMIVSALVVLTISATVFMTACNTEKVVEQAIVNEVNDVKEEVNTKVEEIKSEVEEILPEIPEVNLDETINNAIEGE